MKILKISIDGQRILSIGGGIGGIELIILKKFPNTKIDFIEKNYISDKIRYGWDNNNQEGYNNLSITENFFILMVLITLNIIFMTTTKKFPKKITI